MLTSAAVTPSRAVGASLASFSILYPGLMLTVVLQLRRLADRDLPVVRGTPVADALHDTPEVTHVAA
jgi:hypothetical protein